MLRSILFLLGVGVSVCNTLDGMPYTIKLLTNKKRSVLIAGNETTPIADCKLFGDRTELHEIKELMPHIIEKEVEDDDDFFTLALICDKLMLDKEKENTEKTTVPEKKWTEAIQGIRPGTKWCGKGDIANGFDNLGEYAELDKCCRTHDHCPTFVEALTKKFGIFNKAPYTKNSCECDEAFRQCMLGLKSDEGNQLCRIFFNYLQMECLSYDYPNKCTSSFLGLCLQEQKDTTQPKVYSFISQPTC